MAEIERDRERVIQTLCAQYANDNLSTQELELRFERAYQATTSAELQGLVAGLPALPASSLALPSANTPAPTQYAPPVEQERRRLVIMSEYKAKGDWRPARRTVVKAVMGSVTFDLRTAVLAEGVTEFDIAAIMGEVKFIVPPWVRVEADGMAIMGSFDHQHSSSQDPHAPVIRITGAAIMGSVVVKTRLPGESALEAWRRQRREE
jgi:hypothetical protein